MQKIILWLTVLLLLLSMAGCAAYDPYNGGEKLHAPTGGLTEDAGAAEPSAAPGDEMDEASGDQSPAISAGMLTAGEWKDAENLEFWTRLLNRNDWYALMQRRDLFTNRVVTTVVRDENGNGCFGIPVLLCDESGQVLYEAVTDVTGRAYLLYGLSGQDETPTSICVGAQNYPISDEIVEITAESAGLAVTKLDLMLMIDTTGSMSDELRYLQKELEDVLHRIGQAGEGVSIHMSVNFYRDEGDDYIVRDFEFTGDHASALQQLLRQEADGGGDYPEAVHQALDSIVYGHQWRNDAVKLCFFVLDAPPHSEGEIKGINAKMRDTVKAAARKGIRLIPVASSGVDTETEFLLRSWALMTGGTYTFLTDHSGIGNDHLEPTIGQYEVEALNECLIRIISEYCALEYSKPEA